MPEKKRGPGRPKQETVKSQVGVKLDPDLLERLRNAVFALGGDHTINGIIEQATLRALERLEEANGGPFPVRRGRIPRSRIKK